MRDEIDLSGRWDIYGPIHKGLRHALSGLLVRLGNADCEDRPAYAALLVELRAQLALSAGHMRHEDEHIHAALERRAAGASERVDAQHGDHRRRFIELEALIEAAEMAWPERRAAAARALYLHFSLFVAEDFAHMHEEETETWPLLCAHFTDDELRAIEMAIIASLPPETGMAHMRIMLPAMTSAERLGLLSGMKAAAPAEELVAVMARAARPTLPPKEFWDLADRLGMAA